MGLEGGQSRVGRSGLWPDWLPVGVAIMAGLAAVSSALVAARPAQASAEKVMWTFARPHFLMYEPRIKEWNASGRTRFELRLLSLPAIERRMMASFLGDVPSADVIETERRPASRPICAMPSRGSNRI